MVCNVVGFFFSETLTMVLTVMGYYFSETYGVYQCGFLFFRNINNGVYRCGFARRQQAYDDAVIKLFDHLDKVINYL
jgi:glutathionyl-hydroquinone reductase